MRRFVFHFFLALASFQVHAQTNDPGTDTINRLIETKVKPYIAATGAPGAAVAIFYRGQDYFYLYGFADQSKRTPVKQDTIFDLASVTKVFTTTLLAVEIQAGKLKLSDPIVKYLPDLASTRDLPIDTVTVRDLATHTASFPRQVEEFGVAKGKEQALMQKLKSWQPEYPVGTRYRYSNVSFGLLGLVTANAAGLSYPALLQKQLLDPLGMDDTMITVPPEKISLQALGYNARGQAEPFVTTYLYGGGSLRSSPADMLQFLKANLNVTETRAPSSLLSAMQFAQQPEFEVKPAFVLGLGWQRLTRNNHLFITKNGANQGFTSFIGFSPEQKFGVVVLINRKKSKAGKLGNQVLDYLASAPMTMSNTVKTSKDRI